MLFDGDGAFRSLAWLGDRVYLVDRKGFAFKVDFGSLDSLCACYSAAGLAANIQFGYFPHHRLGLLGTLTLGGGKNALDQTFQRHSANLEAQFFPLEWWRFHLGGFGHGGYQVARDEFGTRTGPVPGVAARSWKSPSPRAWRSPGAWTTQSPAPRPTANRGLAHRRSPQEWRSTDSGTPPSCQTNANFAPGPGDH